eukprot:282872-Karenia_brevis.AAC.1
MSERTDWARSSGFAEHISVIFFGSLELDIWIPELPLMPEENIVVEDVVPSKSPFRWERLSSTTELSLPNVSGNGPAS